MKLIKLSLHHMVLNIMKLEGYRQYNKVMFDLAGVAPEHILPNIVQDTIYARINTMIGSNNVRSLGGRL